MPSVNPFSTELSTSDVQNIVEGLVPARKYKLTSSSTTSSTLSVDAQLTTDMLAVGTYAVSALLIVYSASSVVLKAAVIAATGSGVCSVLAWNREQATSVAIGDPFLPRDAGNGTQTPIRVETVITLSSVGTIGVQWASHGGGNAELRAGSWLETKKIS